MIARINIGRYIVFTHLHKHGDLVILKVSYTFGFLGNLGKFLRAWGNLKICPSTPQIMYFLALDSLQR